jgi:hypothetical protein
MAADEVREMYQTAPCSRLMNGQSTIKEKMKHQKIIINGIHAGDLFNNFQ